MSYIQGFLVPVPEAKKDAYRALAEKTVPLFREYGAKRIVEGWGNDLPKGKVTDFHGAVKAEEGETVVFSWIVWPSKRVCDDAAQKMRDDPRMKMFDDTPFDGKRMVFGGFDVLLDTGPKGEGT